MTEPAFQPPDFIEPVVGWRIFRFCDEQEVVLRSLSRRGPWPTGRGAAAICFALAPYAKSSHSHIAHWPRRQFFAQCRAGRTSVRIRPASSRELSRALRQCRR